MNTRKTLLVMLFGLWSLIAFAQPQMPDPPTVEIKLDQTTVSVGEMLTGKAIVSFAPGLHGYQNPQSDPSIIPIELKGGEGVPLESVEYPKGTSKVIPAISSEPYFLHEGTIEIGFSLKAPSSVSKEGIPFEFSFQQCDDANCFPPDVVTAYAQIEIKGATIGSGTTAGTDPPATTSATTEAPVANSEPSSSESKEGGLIGFIRDAFVNQAWLSIIPAMLLVGLLINLTPCVYPLIPITLSFFANQEKQAGKSRVMLGVMYMLGMALTFGAVGGIAAGSGGIFGDLFTQPWFNVALGVLMVVLALSMFDLYQIGLPPFITKQLKGRSGPVGAFIMGLFVGFAAAPCAGPFIVAIFTEVAKLGNVPVGIGVFTLIGMGIGLPYVFLAAAAVGAKALPKAGTWMKAVKAGMGILVLYFGVDYLLRGLPSLPDSSKPAIWAAFFGIAGIFMLWYEGKGADQRAWWIKGGVAMLCGFAMGSALTSGSAAARSGGESLAWAKFDDASFATAKASGKPIFIDVTADWCAECKVIEATVLNTPGGEKALKEVSLLKIDLSTGVDAAYKKKVQDQFGIVGLPHLIFMKPGGEVSKVVNGLHSVEELEKLIQEASS